MESDKKMGRPPKAPEDLFRKRMVSFAPEVHEWLKAQPGGVSKTIDELARKAMPKEKKR